jgi:hypothetical protein
MGRRFAQLLATGAIVLSNGCSPQTTTGVVTGTVTLDGVLLETGQIRFVPVDGQTPTAGAVIIDGRYSATVVPGQKTVEISSPLEAPARPMYDIAPEPATDGADGDLVPAKYNTHTELKLEVRPGEMQHNFQLTSK